MIGKFDGETIESHEESFKSGKLNLRDVKVDKRELMFSEIDCQAQVLESVSDDDEDIAEFLRELEEERRAREQMEADDDDKKKKKKDKKKKKGKKGKKSEVNDEL